MTLSAGHPPGSAHVFRHRGLEVRFCPETMQAEIAGARLEPCPPPAMPPAPAPADMPVATIVLMLTQTCNLRCRYCYGEAGRFGSAGVMSQGTALRAVDWLFDRAGAHTTLRIGFMGGEPFLNFSVLEAAVRRAEMRAEVARKKVRFYTTTNGTCLDPPKIEFLKAHDISVQVSFDGPPSVQNRNRPLR